MSAHVRVDVAPGLRPGSVRGLRLCRLAAGDLRALLGPDPPIEHESGDRQDKRRRERGDPMDQNVHSGEALLLCFNHDTESDAEQPGSDDQD